MLIKLMSLYNLIEYSFNYSSASGSSWQYQAQIQHLKEVSQTELTRFGT